MNTQQRIAELEYMLRLAIKTMDQMHSATLESGRTAESSARIQDAYSAYRDFYNAEIDDLFATIEELKAAHKYEVDQLSRQNLAANEAFDAVMDSNKHLQDELNRLRAVEGGPIKEGEPDNCPCCGGTAGAERSESFSSVSFGVRCHQCGLYMPGSNSLNEAIERWNKRQSNAQIEELKSELAGYVSHPDYRVWTVMRKELEEFKSQADAKRSALQSRVKGLLAERDTLRKQIEGLKKDQASSLFADIRDDLPRDIKALDKLKCGSLSTGKRIYWYYKEDAQFCKKDGTDPRSWDYYSGIIVPAPDAESSSQMEFDKVVIIHDRYPCEKCNPETVWVTLGRLLENDDLVEIYADID